MKKRRTSKTLAIGLACTLLLGSLFGCASGETQQTETEQEQVLETTQTTESEQNETTASGGVTLTLMTFSSWDTPALDKGIELYEAASGNTIEKELIPDDQMLDLIYTRLATDTDVPDLVGAYPLTQFNVAQLSEYFLPMEGEWIDQLSLGKETYAAADGNVYAATYGGATALGLMYNKQIMEENGIELPLMNYEEFIAACETLKANGVTPLSISNKENWTGQILYLGDLWPHLNEEEIAGITSGELTFAEVPALRTLMENMEGLYTGGYFNEDYMSTTMDMSVEDVATGECAMTPAGDWSYTVLQTNFPDAVENVGMIPTPIWNDSVYVNIGTSSKQMMVTKNGKAGNSEAAMEFAEFLMTPECLQAMFEVEPGICPINGVEVEQNAWAKEMVGYAETIPYAPIVTEIANDFGSGDPGGAAQQLFGGASVDDALDYWYESFANVNRAAGKPGF